MIPRLDGTYGIDPHSAKSGGFSLLKKTKMKLLTEVWPIGFGSSVTQIKRAS